MRSLCSLKIIIIDEISMVGVNIFANIHDIMGLGSANSVFGGVSVLAVGYLLQLPPVGALPVFSSYYLRDPLCKALAVSPQYWILRPNYINIVVLRLSFISFEGASLPIFIAKSIK
jgi:hypothetical protein